MIEREEAEIWRDLNSGALDGPSLGPNTKNLRSQPRV